jgi:RNA polymerase sigma factor (sigma-70 family)
MNHGLPSSLFRHLRNLADSPSARIVPDSQLLERFLTRRDEAAFEVLLWRHGTLVWGVCRRLLRDEQAAEDAFQATFLIFLRKAASIGKRDSIAGWLYKVALRTALAARARQQRSGVPVPDLHLLPAENNVDSDWEEIQAILDEEVNHLPSKYRAPFILCYLQGKTNGQAAGELGCCEGTVVSRLAWARRRLRQRLAQRGLAVSAGLLMITLVREAAAGGPNGILIASTLDSVWRFTTGAFPASSAAAVLAKGVLHTMLLHRLQRPLAAILVAGLVCAGGLSLRHALAGRIEQAPVALPAAAQGADRSSQAQVDMQGTWEMGETVQESINSQPQPPRKRKAVIVITGDRLSTLGEGGFLEWQYRFKVDPTHQPGWIDLTSPVLGALTGIYRLEGDSLQIYLDRFARPARFPEKLEPERPWNLKRVSRTPAKVAERFPAAPGCFWMEQPTAPGSTMATLGMVRLYETDREGAGLIALAYAKPDPRTNPAKRYRPVVLDAQGNRHLPGPVGGGYSEDPSGHGVSLYRWRMDPKLLPAAKIAHLGIEAETEEADRMDASKALAEARKAGIEVLPWPEVGKQYPFELTTLDGRKLRSQDFAGKVVVLDCWATWCSPCMQKCLELKPLYERWQDRGFEIIGISWDQSEAAARKACERNGFNWPQVFVPTAEEKRALWERATGIRGIPRLLIIDRNGILRDDSPEKLDEIITKLLKQ